MTDMQVKCKLDNGVPFTIVWISPNNGFVRHDHTILGYITTHEDAINLAKSKLQSKGDENV